MIPRYWKSTGVRNRKLMGRKMFLSIFSKGKTSLKGFSRISQRRVVEGIWILLFNLITNYGCTSMFRPLNLKFHSPIIIRFFESGFQSFRNIEKDSVARWKFFSVYAITIFRHNVVENIKAKVLACSFNCLQIFKTLSFTLSRDPKAAILTLKMPSGRRPCSCQTIPKVVCDNWI